MALPNFKTPYTILQYKVLCQGCSFFVVAIQTAYPTGTPVHGRYPKRGRTPYDNVER